MSDLLLSPEQRYAKIIEEKRNEDGSELNVLNLGPTHPATHGIFQNILLMDGERILEAELEGDVFLGIPVVVEMDLVQPVRVERKIVGAAVGVLERLVVRDERHELIAARLEAVEHVEVGGVDLGRAGDEGRLAVAGCLRTSGQASQRRQRQQRTRQNFLHSHRCLQAKGVG